MTPPDGDWLDPRSWDDDLNADDARRRWVSWAEQGLGVPGRATRRVQRARRVWATDQREVVNRQLSALAAGAEPNPAKPHILLWDVSNGCSLPQDVVWHKKGHPGSIHLTVPCRLYCERCLRRRKMFWAHRAKAELSWSQRSWFGTLTLTPERQSAARAAAVLSAMRAGINWNELLPGDQFGLVVKQVKKDLTLWLKRVRKNSGARMRYILVVEAHESGDPHFHCLVHEVVGSAPITERELRLSWTQHGGGFTKFVLVRDNDPRAAFYVCKYLSKSALSRIRASSAYGSWGPALRAGPSACVSGKRVTA